MSRGSFRARVEAPRPLSAWTLVAVASLTLWITEQLDPWAMAVQAAAIGFSLWRRTAPFGWQQSPVALNVGMIGIATATIVVALRGEPSTIALAHFAALSQGLQLLDSRPRKTEFLLVTLALFQVILAANLTDSVLFPPLLVAFVFSTVWTLMVHTLRMEAIEAGEVRGVGRAITPGLMRNTLIASSLSVVLALALFVVLPRLRSSVVNGSSVAPTLATAGFSDKVALGELGRIRLDATVVLRVETLEGRPPPAGQGYWRGLAFDRFDGTSWSITPPGRRLVPGTAEGGVVLGRDPSESDLVQRIVREPVEAGVLFGIDEPLRIQGTVRRLERDVSDGLYAAGQADERVRYTISSRLRSWREESLRRDETSLPRRQGERYLQLPELSDAVGELARTIVQGLETDADRARALERHLLRSGRYSNVPPSVDPAAARSPVETFLLGEMAGHCEYFASSMVVLLRSVDIPARLVNGFAGGRENEIGNFLEVTRSDAHTWVEVHYTRHGWVRYDPTPADLRARPLVALSLAERMRQLSSAVELWWYQSVVGFDRSDQIHALKQAWLAWRAARDPDGAPRSRRQRARAPDLQALLACALPLLGAAAVLAAGAAWWRRRAGPACEIPAVYARALRLLARRGLVRAPQTTARDFAAEIRTKAPERAARAFEQLTEGYLAERFGQHTGAADPARLELLKRALSER